MKTATVSKLKATLSKYLSGVKAGEEVIVTERGRPVARIVPYTRSGPTPAELDEMVRAGLIRMPLRPLNVEFWSKPSPVKDPEGLVLKALLEERESGR